MKIEEFKVKNIIFDLGGVILDIDIKTVFEKFSSMGIGPGHDGYHLINHNNVFKRYEVGEISTDEFRNELRKVSNHNFADKDFDKIWNAIIVGFPLENIKILEKIKSSYRTFLMSNTNELHYILYNEMLRQNFGYSNLDDLFEKGYYSHISNMRKPDSVFFQLILDENNLVPSETLFIDDFAENIETADRLGLKTFHLADGKKLSDIF